MNTRSMDVKRADKAMCGLKIQQHMSFPIRVYTTVADGQRIAFFSAVVTGTSDLETRSFTSNPVYSVRTGSKGVLISVVTANPDSG